MSKATRATITPRDIEIGRRIRARRAVLNVSQTNLADKLGVTFQQVQKYEKGTNRVASGRLEQISQVLRCSVSYFFDDIKNVDGSDDALKFFRTRDVIRLAEAYSKIENSKQRFALVELAETMASRK